MPFHKNGFTLISNVFNNDSISLVTNEVKDSDIGNCRGGIRNAEKKFRSIRLLLSSDKLTNIARDYLSGNPQLVRVIYFDKTPKNNWLVTWHQDKTVAVTKKFDREGWGPWSTKDSIQHVQPPLSVLNNMITLRIHLDIANKASGCLKVMPTSHKLGLLCQEDIHKYCQKHIPVNCIANCGDVLVMRPHLLHSSSKAINPTSRRIIHIEYCGDTLPEGVQWAGS